MKKMFLNKLFMRIAKLLLMSLYIFFEKRPFGKKIIIKIANNFPSVFDKLKTYGREENDKKRGRLFDKGKFIFQDRKSNNSHDSTLEDLVFKKNKKLSRVYIYVDHTCNFSYNTGVQRVVRNLSKSLFKLGIEIIFVKWDNEYSSFCFLNKKELKVLSLYGGIEPELLVKKLSINYIKNGNKPIDLLGLNLTEEWLVVPEVTYINNYNKDLTREILVKAKSLMMKSAFIFYDAIPLHRPEFMHLRGIHTDYMRELSLADMILPISNFSRDDYLSFLSNYKGYLRPKLHIQTITLGCDFEDREITIPPNIKEPYILCVGSITRHKNQITLLRAFTEYCQENPNTRYSLLVLGNISPEMRYEFYNELKLNDKIHFAQSISDRNLLSAYKYCSFTVFPSAIEGFGLPIIESLKLGKPCITTNFGAMAESGNKPGCELTNTLSVTGLKKSLKKMIEDDKFRERKTKQAEMSKIDNWSDYSESLIKILTTKRRQKNPLLTKLQEKSRKRIFWLGMHKILVETELKRLRLLGFEVFNPPYLSHIADQSAKYDWDENQDSSLPLDVFNLLSATNFFYVDHLSETVTDILNTYFDIIIVTISPSWLAPVLESFNGKIIYSVYGQAHSISDELIRLGVKKKIENHKNFHFVPHAIEAVQAEANWLRKNEKVIPYCLSEDVFGFSSSWVGATKNNKEVILSCPNINNSFFKEHYDYLKENFNEDYFRIYGVQTSKIRDKAVVGTIPRHKQLEAFRQSACYLYTYDDPRVCYLPPIECMVIGLPVIFKSGSLLDMYFSGTNTPARYQFECEAITLINRIKEGDIELINRIKSFQKDIIIRYQPAYVWAEFDNFYSTMLGD